MSLFNKLRAFIRPRVALEKPIFLVGCAKSGTTLTGLLFTYHPDIGPKVSQQPKYTTLQEFVEGILSARIHGTIAPDLEDKPIWDRYFPMNAELRIGKELTLLENPLSEVATKALLRELTRDFRQRRYFSKQPFNSFRVHVLREIFPDAKLLAIHRDGRDVVSSWGRLHDRWEKYGGMENAITMLATKWNETIDHIERYKNTLGIETFKYEELVRNPESMMKRLCDYCEIQYQTETYAGLRLENQVGKWRQRVDSEWHDKLNQLTQRNLERLGYLP